MAHRSLPVRVHQKFRSVSYECAIVLRGEIAWMDVTLLRTEAEALRLALHAGIVSIPEIIVWADTVIAAEDKPDIIIIELALAAAETRERVSPRLAQFAGDVEALSAIRIVLRLLAHRLQSSPEKAQQIARQLYAFATSVEWLSDVLGTEPFWLDDLFDPTSNANDDEAVKSLREYLSVYV